MMWESIAEIALTVVRWFVKDAAARAARERAILEALERWTNRPPQSKRLRDAYADILKQIEEDKRNGVWKKEAAQKT